MTIASAIAVFQKADGALRHLAPAELAPDEGDQELGWIALPADFEQLPYRWVEASATYVVDEIELRARRWIEVRAARDAVQAAGCMTPLGRVDTDLESQLKITGSVQMATLAQMAGQPFAVDWTMHDNSTVTHDAAAMIAMGLAVGQHIAACHEAARGKRGALEAAVSLAEIEAVDVDGGWPA